MAAEAAIAKPAYIIESGPAAGVIAAVAMARRIGLGERDLARHGRHHRESGADRARRTREDHRIRGGRRHQSQQPAGEGRRPCGEAAVHRHLRDRRRRRQHRLGGQCRFAEGRAAQRRRRAWAGLLRPRRHRADVHRCDGRAGLHQSQSGLAGGRVRLRSRRWRTGRSPNRWRSPAVCPVRGGVGNLCGRRGQHDARGEGGFDLSRPRSARLRADGVRRQRSGCRCRNRARACKCRASSCRRRRACSVRSVCCAPTPNMSRAARCFAACHEVTPADIQRRDSMDGDAGTGAACRPMALPRTR